jgi:hypothetical protein
MMALPFTLKKKYLKPKKGRIMETQKYFHQCKNIIISSSKKNPLKQNQKSFKIL